MVDIAHRRLVNTDSYLSTALQAALSNLDLHISALTDAYAHLITSYLYVFRTELRQTPTAPTKQGNCHHIKTTGPLVFAKFRYLAPDQLAASTQTFAKMEGMGVWRKASALRSSPIHMFLKKDGSLCPCGDYRNLNMQTEPDHYPLPNITDVTSYLHKATVFSMLDLLNCLTPGLPITSDISPLCLNTITPFYKSLRK
ncbi:uncharacterized protein [Palaemon carinicauda]|uniref:uncharacterized protein n=1 Tax=Palaemon carinicauda TaxID=392227 RepID=UPI0035B5D50D